MKPLISLATRNLTTKEACAILNVSKKWMYKHWREIPGAQKLGHRTLRFDEAELRHWIETKKWS